MGPLEILALLAKALEVGVPAIMKAIASFQTASGREPTLEEILAITKDLKPPQDYK